MADYYMNNILDRLEDTFNIANCNNYQQIQNILENGDKISTGVLERILAVCVRDLKQNTQHAALAVVSAVLAKLKAEKYTFIPDLAPSALAIVNMMKETQTKEDTLPMLSFEVLLSFPDNTLVGLVTSHTAEVIELFGTCSCQTIVRTQQAVKEIDLKALKLLGKLLKILPHETKEEFVKLGLNVWFCEIIPRTISFTKVNNPDVITYVEVLELLIDSLIHINYEDNPHWNIVLKCICDPKKYPAIIKDLLMCNCDSWYRLWIIIIRLLKKQSTTNITASVSPINSMLPIIELAYGFHEKTRYQAFQCWNALIDHFALELDDYPADFHKIIDILNLILKPNNTKLVDIDLSKFNTWWYLLRRMQSKMDSNIDMHLIPFLNFCFGELPESYKDSRNNIVSPGQFSVNMRKQCLEALVEIAGHDDCEGCVTLVPKLESKLINAKILVDHWNDWISYLKNATMIAAIDCDKLSKRQVTCLWKSFLMIIGEIQENQIRNELFNDMLATITKLCQTYAMDEKIADIAFNVLINSLLDNKKIRHLLKNSGGSISPIQTILESIVTNSLFHNIFIRNDSTVLLTKLNSLISLNMNASPDDFREWLSISETFVNSDLNAFTERGRSQNDSPLTDFKIADTSDKKCNKNINPNNSELTVLKKKRRSQIGSPLPDFDKPVEVSNVQTKPNNSEPVLNNGPRSQNNSMQPILKNGDKLVKESNKQKSAINDVKHPIIINEHSHPMDSFRFQSAKLINNAAFDDEVIDTQVINTETKQVEGKKQINNKTTCHNLNMNTTGNTNVGNEVHLNANGNKDLTEDVRTLKPPKLPVSKLELSAANIKKVLARKKKYTEISKNDKQKKIVKNERSLIKSQLLIDMVESQSISQIKSEKLSTKKKLKNYSSGKRTTSLAEKIRRSPSEKKMCKKLKRKENSFSENTSVTVSEPQEQLSQSTDDFPMSEEILQSSSKAQSSFITTVSKETSRPVLMIKLNYDIKNFCKKHQLNEFKQDIEPSSNSLTEQDSKGDTEFPKNTSRVEDNIKILTKVHKNSEYSELSATVNEDLSGSSSLLKDEVQINKDILNDTKNISPITIMNPEIEKKSPSPKSENESANLLNTPASRKRISSSSACENTEQQENENKNLNFLKFKKRVPTADCSPSVSILKRKLADVVDEATVSPANKKKGDSIPDLYVERKTSSKRKDKQMRVNMKSTKKRDNKLKWDTVLNKVIKNFFKEHVNMNRNNISPTCSNDYAYPIDNIVGKLSLPAIKTLFMKNFEGIVETFNDWANNTKPEVNTKPPNVKKAKKQSELNSTEDELILDVPDTISESQQAASVQDQTNPVFTSSCDMQTGAVPVMVVNKQTDIVPTIHADVQTDESGNKSTHDVILKVKRVTFRNPPVSKRIAVEKYIKRKTSSKRRDKQMRGNMKSKKKRNNVFNLDTVLNKEIKSFFKEHVSMKKNNTNPTCSGGYADPIDNIVGELSLPTIKTLVKKNLEGIMEIINDWTKNMEPKLKTSHTKPPYVKKGKKQCELNSAEDELILDVPDTISESQQAASVQDQTNPVFTSSCDVQTSAVPVMVVNKQTDIVPTIHADVQTDESGNKSTHDVIETCLLEKSIFIDQLSEQG